MGSSGTEDSGTKGINSWEVEADVAIASMIMSSAGYESGICMPVGVSGEGW